MKILLAILFVALVGGFIWVVNLPSNIAETHESKQLPVISRLDILHASDLISGVKLALEKNDSNAIDDWLDKAIELAIIAELSKEDIDYLQSDRARKYVIFHAKRRLFSDTVERAYYALYDIETIKAQYPEALDLFADADKLIFDRNKLIQQIAAELAHGMEVNDKILLEAQQNWKQRFIPTATADDNSE
jgi:hypothetical protein